VGALKLTEVVDSLSSCCGADETLLETRLPGATAAPDGRFGRRIGENAGQKLRNHSPRRDGWIADYLPRRSPNLCRPTRTVHQHPNSGDATTSARAVSSTCPTWEAIRGLPQRHSASTAFGWRDDATARRKQADQSRLVRPDIGNRVTGALSQFCSNTSFTGAQDDADVTNGRSLVVSPVPQRRRITERTPAEVIEHYNRGMSSRRVAATLGLGRTTVLEILKYAGVAPRPRGQRY
jgi:hypothetical protein